MSHDEPGTGGQADLSHWHREPCWRAAAIGIGGKAVLRLGHANRQIAIALLFPILELVADLLIGKNLIGTVDVLGNRFDFGKETHVVRIDRCEIRLFGIGNLSDTGRQISGPFRAQFPVARQHGLGTLGGHIFLNRVHFGVCISDEVVDRDDDRHAERLHVLDVTAKVRTALLYRIHALCAEIRFGYAAIHLHRAHSGNHDDPP